MLSSLSSDVFEAAAQAAGNWRKFDSFAWHDRPEDADRWAIFNTTSRDAGLLAQSNHAAIDAAMAPFRKGDEPSVRVHGASHWAVGWVEGFEVRVFDAAGEVTAAFRAFHGLAMALAEYPVLDDSDYSERQHAAALEAIDQVGGKFLRTRAPKDWAGRIFSWLWDNEQSECEDDGQDRGAYPSEASVLRAMAALKLLSRDGRAAYRDAA